MKLVGHAVLFNSLSVDLGGFVEKVAPGAFARTLASGKTIFAVHHHNFENVLASTKSGSLKLSEDARGLRFEIAMPETSLGHDIHALVKRGDLSSMSFSFRINGAQGESWRERSDGVIERTLLDLDLFEISTVANPAYPSSEVFARAIDARATKNEMLARTMRARLARVQLVA